MWSSHFLISPVSQFHLTYIITPDIYIKEGYEKNGTRCVSFKSLLSGNFVCGGCYEQECRPRRVASKSGRPPLPSYKFTGNLTAKESVSAKYLHPKERQDLTKFMLISRSNKSFIIQSVVNKKYVKQSAEESETSDDEMSAGESSKSFVRLKGGHSKA